MWGTTKKGTSNEVQNNMCNHSCSRCGECCGLFIPFNDDEVDLIKKYVKLHNIKPVNRIDETGVLKAHCCFYDEEKRKCTIYSVRPFVCRDFRCDRKDWKKYRDVYEQQHKYNSTMSTKTIMATFDDIVYKDYSIIIRYILGSIPRTEHGIEADDLYYILKHVNRLDLFNYFDVYDENQNKIQGRDFVKKYKGSDD